MNCVMVAVFDVLAEPQIGKMYKFLAVLDETEVPAVDVIGRAVMPALAVPV